MYVVNINSKKRNSLERSFERCNNKRIIFFSFGKATIHILSPNSDDISNVESFWKKKLIIDGLLSKAHSEEFWDDAFEYSLSKDKPGFIIMKEMYLRVMT